MTLTAVIILVISAALHAGWNLLGKREHPTTAFFLVAVAGGFLILSPMLWLGWDIVALFSARLWGMLMATGFCLAVYFAALGGAYRHGDMSVAYPLARSSPIIVVTIVVFLMGRGNEVSSQCMAGIVLVVIGCFLLPMKNFNQFQLNNYINRSCLLAVLAAFCTAGYSMIDDEVLRHLRDMAGEDANHITLTLAYACMEATSTMLWLLLFVIATGKNRKDLVSVYRTKLGRAALTGVGIYVTYALALISLAFVTNVSYVVAFRQLSILLGTVAAVVILKEPAHKPKFIGVSIMFVGLVLVGTG